jgi:hypothetical protein
MDESFFDLVIASIPGMNEQQQFRMRDTLLKSFPVLFAVRTDGTLTEADRLFQQQMTVAEGPIKKALAFKAGDRVRLTGNISPQYLLGRLGTVEPMGGSTLKGRSKIRVMVKLDQAIGRFTNTYPIGVPVYCVEKVTP